MADDGTEDVRARTALTAGAPRPVDADLLGLEPDPTHPNVWSLVVEPHLCRTDGRFYGGAALAAALACAEAATGRPALWSTTQLVGVGDPGELLSIAVEVVASGRTIDQVQVRGTTGAPGDPAGRLVFSAVGSTASPNPEGIHAVGRTMPRVHPPDEAPPWGRLGMDAHERPRVGNHLVSEHRAAALLDPRDDRPGHFALWARMTEPAPDGEPAAQRPPRTASSAAMTPAILGFLADMVPLAVCQAAGVQGAGTSLDNSLRLGEVADTEWVLLELDADVAVGGLGHGHVHLWSPDGRLLGVGTQSARLFTIDDFVNRRAR